MPSAAEAARVQALLDGSKPASAPSAGSGRFIVQVGAYADSKSAQEARMRLERMGLKTYVQAVETKDGKRIRVRVGPYASREEADKVAGKVRDSGLSTAVLSL
jgi:DedD protein